MPYTIDTVEKGQIRLTVVEHVPNYIFYTVPWSSPGGRPCLRLIQKGVTWGEIFPELFNEDGSPKSNFASDSVLTLKDGNTLRVARTNRLAVYTGNTEQYIVTPSSYSAIQRDTPFLVCTAKNSNRYAGIYNNLTYYLIPPIWDTPKANSYIFNNQGDVVSSPSSILDCYLNIPSAVGTSDIKSTSDVYHRLLPVTIPVTTSPPQPEYINSVGVIFQSLQLNPTQYTAKNGYPPGSNTEFSRGYRFIDTYVNEPITTIRATFLSTGADSGNPPDVIDAPIDPDEGTATFTIPDAGSLVKASYALLKWKNKTTGEEYAIGAQCTINAPTDFEPVWVKTQYVAHFTKPADATGTVPSDIYGTIQEDEGVAYITLPFASLVKTDYFFYGWALPSESGDQNEWIRPGTTITIGEDTTFVAVFSRYNPGYPGTPTTPTGGTGSLVEPDSPVVIPSDPGEVILEAENMISVFNPTSSELTALANAMFSSTVLDALKNIIASPIESVISLKVVPFAPSTTQNKYKWKIGLVSVAAPMKLVNDRYVDFNFGALEIKEVWGNFLDYSPNTSAEIFLPYIGYRSVNIDDIMGKTVSLKYKVDVTTGTTVAFLVDSSNNILYQWTGNCAIEVPLNSRDYSTFAGSLLGIATAAASMVATSGATAPAVIAAASSAVSAIPSVSGNTHAGSFDSSYGAISAKKAHFVIHRPKQIIAENGNTFYGYPSNITKRLGDMRGYTEVAYIHMEGFPATRDEIAQIEAMLKEGVIL